jgi:hypothetical protein
MMSIQSIKNDILSLRGADVRVFGQPTTLSDTVDDTLIDVIVFLDHIEGHEVTNFEYEEEMV